MSVDTYHGSLLAARTGPPSVIRRDTNTIVISLEQDQVLALIAEMAEAGIAFPGRPVYLLIEQDEITYPREVFE